MNSSLLSSRWFRISAVILVIFLGILVGLPYLIKQQARIWLEDHGGDRVAIRDVDFNPFTAELVLEDLLIEVEDRQPLHFDTARCTGGRVAGFLHVDQQRGHSSYRRYPAASQ
jgi:hypothetical protein